MVRASRLAQVYNKAAQAKAKAGRKCSASLHFNDEQGNNESVRVSKLPGFLLQVSKNIKDSAKVGDLDNVLIQIEKLRQILSDFVFLSLSEGTVFPKQMDSTVLRLTSIINTLGRANSLGDNRPIGHLQMYLSAIRFLPEAVRIHNIGKLQPVDEEDKAEVMGDRRFAGNVDFRDLAAYGLDMISGDSIAAVRKNNKSVTRFMLRAQVLNSELAQRLEDFLVSGILSEEDMQYVFATSKNLYDALQLLNFSIPGNLWDVLREYTIEDFLARTNDFRDLLSA